MWTLINQMDRLTQSLREGLRDAAKASGFTLSPPSWLRDCGDLVQTLWLDKSPHGESHYLEVTIWLKSLGLPAGKLLPWQGHYRFRADTSIAEEFVALLSPLENPAAPAEVVATRFRLAIQESLIPLLNRMRTCDDLRREFDTTLHGRVGIRKAAQVEIFGGLLP